MMHAEHDDHLMQTADDKTADAVRQLQKGTYCAENTDLECVHDRSDDEEPEQHRDKQRKERRDNEVNDIGHKGLEPFMQTRRKDTKYECGQNRALIADHGNWNPEDLH